MWFSVVAGSAWRGGRAHHFIAACTPVNTFAAGSFRLRGCIMFLCAGFFFKKFFSCSEVGLYLRRHRPEAPQNEFFKFFKI